MRTKKVMASDVKQKAVDTIVNIAIENGLTISNICEVTGEAIAQMCDNATIEKPKIL